jgi:hypothetical protein
VSTAQTEGKHFYKAEASQMSITRNATIRLLSMMVPNKAAYYTFLAICLLSSITDQAYAQALNKRQSCEGIVAFDTYGMLLQDIKKTSSLWCDAYFGDDKDSMIAKQVLAKCPVGSRCIIDGLFSGRGEFSWTRIIFAKQK